MCNQIHIQPSELDNMPFYEFEQWIKNLNEHNKEENDKQEKEQKSSNIPDVSSFNPSKYLNNLPKFNK